MRPFYLIHLKGMPIFSQLQLEEALLRQDARNFCLINEGSPPAIVMGISGKAEELIDVSKAQALNIPVIKRFSGGGTVIVDEDTLFITFICQKDSHPFPAYPEPILKWSASLYAQAFPFISLQENDYVIGNKKCGGNAQYIKKERWLHHTSFLWKFKPSHMELLLHPKKTPLYRKERSHADFLTSLSLHSPTKELWINSFKDSLKALYEVIDLPCEDLSLSTTHRQTTKILDL
jgi:lipoate-protein ligase A